MSQTFTGTHKTAFSMKADTVYMTRETSGGLQRFYMPLADMLEFVAHLEQGRVMPERPDISLRQQSDAWSAVWDQCVGLGMLDMKSADAQSGQERVVAFVALLDAVEQREKGRS